MEIFCGPGGHEFGVGKFDFAQLLDDYKEIFRRALRQLTVMHKCLRPKGRVNSFLEEVKAIIV